MYLPSLQTFSTLRPLGGRNTVPPSACFSRNGSLPHTRLCRTGVQETVLETAPFYLPTIPPYMR
ncbi:hypothetical protein ATPR_3085 [Acetobacter tropicalis NBRC 101654]|uniref:Uncharacterized protein n=1 Tax=Acetobacter tropicalis NBRC 101654 TaxID=749388 RepID=F7VI86_9PROT|nr:hypothetical protein ATPR_3085 [Acetobacter tropicalis NBRC 101654]